jgi:metal-dependent hydrolase (beta-lactamase superfamily II)
MEQVCKKPAARDMGEKPVEYFYLLIGTRHTDHEDGLQYKVTEIKVNKKKEIVAYRQRIYEGQCEENVDKHYHVADIYSYTKINLDDFMELTDDTQEKQPKRVPRRNASEAKP